MTEPSLMVQWIRIHLPMQGTRVQSLVQEESTCHGSTQACVPQLLSLRVITTEAHVPRACVPQ